MTRENRLLQALVNHLAGVVRGAKLPRHYSWGTDAMEQFEFGKQCAALDIERAPMLPLDTLLAHCKREAFFYGVLCGGFLTFVASVLL